MSPIATRWYSLWQVPDVALPFDVEDVIQDDVPKDEDAIYHYEVAQRLLEQAPPPCQIRALIRFPASTMLTSRCVKRFSVTIRNGTID